jgi:hypothetical protein
MKYLVFILSLIFFNSCTNKIDKENSNITQEATELILGELIDGPANIRDSVNGKIIFTLNDNLLVETSPKQNNWLSIGLYISLTNKQHDESKIYPNSDLLAENGQIIGKTLDTVNILMSGEKVGLIVGYTHVTNIKEHTIPEKALEHQIIKQNFTLNSLKSYLTAFDFKEYDENSELKYKQLYITETTLVDISPRDRITILFNKGNNLIGVIHSRQLSLKNFKTYKLVRGHSLTIFTKLDKSEIKRIINERNKFYNSID